MYTLISAIAGGGTLIFFGSIMLIAAIEGLQLKRPDKPRYVFLTQRVLAFIPGVVITLIGIAEICYFGWRYFSR